MGPFQQLIEMMLRAQQGNAAPGGGSFFDAMPGLGGMKSPAVTTPSFRGPGMEIGPAPPDDRDYQAWRAKLPKELQYEGDYDLRGFYGKHPDFTAAPGQHMTDEFKRPNHPTFSDESRYYNPQTAYLGGHWDGDVFIPNDTRYKKRVDERPIAMRSKR